MTIARDLTGDLDIRVIRLKITDAFKKRHQGEEHHQKTEIYKRIKWKF